MISNPVKLVETYLANSTPKDKLGDWFEAYAHTMELNVWMQSSITSSTYDKASHTWTVNISRAGKPDRVIKPKFIVMATGHSGGKFPRVRREEYRLMSVLEPEIPTFEGQDLFKGVVVHSSQHTTGEDFKGKKAIVVGCCNSGHE